MPTVGPTALICLAAVLAPAVYHTFANPEGDVSAVWVTVPPPHSELLAAKLVEARHAACVNILPKVSSVYRWEGQVTRDTEDLLMVKTLTSRVAELVAFVKQHHPYTVPEVIAVPIGQGNGDYLEWVRANAQPLPPL
eukprot:TRINITY_DN10220_c0_g1_i2.p2 TRINITY_DN10220_c0_g1~~TRINITY_DN10220_c0_g1_i2.p2  ORF type:complete len:137 (+),score=18.78 TRINITY_DN10220_c0_g1_i2:58-468(+)